MSDNPAETESSPALNRRLAQALVQRLDAEFGSPRRAAAGAVLCRAGERPSRLPLVIAGRLDAVLHLGAQGLQVIPITFAAGEVAMFSTLFASRPLQADLVAAEASTLRWLPVPVIERALLRDGELLVMLVRFLAQRLREVQLRERVWLERGVHARVCATLARLAREKPAAPGQPLAVVATHEQLSMRCGVSRPKLSHELKRLEKAGTLRLRRGAIDVLDLRSLDAWA
jgi:CRP/FNR family transcriptional regulator